jgi:predicted TIM-barrel fold metal-dependent hydrolase
VFERSRRYLIVSADSHVGPSLARDLRPYCPRDTLDDFDAFAEAVDERHNLLLATKQLATRDVVRDAMDRCRTCEGQYDPDARLRDMNEEGVAANVMFAGGQNGEELPFVGDVLIVRRDGAMRAVDPRLEAVGCRIFNHWLSDFCSIAPDRLHGVMQIPVKDVARSIAELQESRTAGLRIVNFPAPRSDFPAYNDPMYEPFWSACEDLDLVLCSHVGGGDPALGETGPGGHALRMAESNWLARRALWQLIFGGVFERHPSLRLVFTEQRARWAIETMAELESIYCNDILDIDHDAIQRPTVYWSKNCFITASMLAPFEAALRHEIGLENLMWGGDYPHPEGTWPRTLNHLRYTFEGMPEDDIRLLLGANATSVFGLDAVALRALADRIGPTPEQVAEPLRELPEFRGFAFRQIATYA